MYKFKLKKHEKQAIKFVHKINKGQQSRIDLYFSLPKEMGINKNTLPESEYFNAGIKGRRAYFTKGMHLPLLHSRFASRMKRSPDEYKSNLNLFAYQYIIALDTDTHDALNLNGDESLHNFYHVASDIGEQCLTILKKHRSYIPKDDKLQSIFENVDNYLSWYTEQSILRMLAKKPRIAEFSKKRQALLEICEQENAYRSAKVYNSAATLKDPNRIANKMRLIRRLIEFSVIFKSDIQDLGKITRKVVTGVATALIMSVVLVLIIKTQGALSGISSLMIFVLAVIYGVREVFKDDFKAMLWRWIRKGKPKWSRTLSDAMSRNEIAWQKVWLDYIKESRLPEKTQALLAMRHSQNKQSAEFLHYRLETKVTKEGFQAGYDTIEESIVFSLLPLSRYLERGSDKVYERNDPATNKDKIQSSSIERRYQINLVVAINQGNYNEIFERYKITLDRSGIIELRKADAFAVKDPQKQPRYSKLWALLNLHKQK